jgi:tetratricopeptide (TPR) repeat protein
MPLCMAGFICIAAILPGCIKPTGSYTELMSNGLGEYKNGHYAEAIAMFKNAAEADQERPEPSYYTGRCYLAMADKQFREDDLPGALRYCDRAYATFDASVGAFPGYSRAVQAKADALQLKGKHAAALEVANWAAKYVGPQAKMHIFKARQYAQAGEIDKAQLYFQQAVSVEPENAAAHAELGLFFMRLGNDAAAIKELQKANELSPAAPGILSALAKLGAEPQTPAPVNKAPATKGH